MKARVLVGTGKGMIVRERKNQSREIAGNHFDGIPVNMVFENEYSVEWLAALDHGHWGNKLQRSSDKGKTWQEIEAAQYPEGSEVDFPFPCSRTSKV